MLVSHYLRRIDQALQPLTEPLARGLCEHRLAQAGRDAERAHGFVRRDRAILHPRLGLIPRQGRFRDDRVFSGFRASAAFGAQGALGLIRSDLPQVGYSAGQSLARALEAAIWMPVCGAHAALEGAAALWHAPSLAEKARQKRWRASVIVQTAALLAPMRRGLGTAGCLIGALPGALEWLGGSAHFCRLGGQLVRHPHDWPLWYGLRDGGALGWAQAHLHAASQRPWVRLRPGATIALLGVAVAMGCAAVVARMAAAAVMGAVAGVGALVGVAFEAWARLAYHLDPFGHTLPHVMPLRALEIPGAEVWAGGRLEPNFFGPLPWADVFDVWPDEPDAILAAHAQRLQGFDAQLAALDAQLRRDQDLRRQVRRQRHALQAFPPADVLFARRAFQFQMPDLQAAMGPQAGPPRPLAPSQGGPEMLPRAAADNNVHGLGRDAAARRAMATLLHRYEALDVNDTLDDLRQFMMRHFERRGRLAVDLHESGCSVLSAAAKVLGSDVPIARMMPLALLHPSNTLAISEQGFEVVSMARICAVIWHTIGTLECPPTDPMGTEALRTERKEAFIRAMSRCLLSPTLLVCAPGQSQRLLMVLQGFVPGMQVEIFDAPAPVAQFVTAQALKLRAQLGEEGPFAAQTVRQSLDAVCLEGHALYQGKERLDMEKQLQDLAFWSYDLEGWAPPGA